MSDQIDHAFRDALRRRANAANNPQSVFWKEIENATSEGRLDDVEAVSVGQGGVISDLLLSSATPNENSPLEVELKSVRTKIRAFISTRRVELTHTSEELEQIRVSALGKNGYVNEFMRSLSHMSPEERKARGAEINQLKDRLTEAIATRKAAFEEADLERRLKEERIDVTLSVAPEAEGRIHPLSQVMDEIVEIFGAMGFAVAEGPDIETDERNFTALNIPAEHPARQMHDTFYFREKADGSRLLLRTHTSPVQVRTMLAQKPPIRVIAPGRVYRCDSDQTHTPQFHQVEALVIDEETHMGHLKWCIEEFCRAFFEVKDIKMRFRPSHFPFTEPSAEVDIQCDRSGGEIKFGQGEDWLEILGCGVVHPNVLKNCGIDPARYQGFAFGMGIDRLAMLKYGIPDLRAFFEADLRWHKHYGFSVLDVPTLSAGLSS